MDTLPCESKMWLFFTAAFFKNIQDFCHDLQLLTNNSLSP